MSFVKYRVHEVAKDFGKQTKEISDIMAKYFTAPKNHMQVLEDNELAVIFDYLTQHNQIESMESVFADVYHEPKPAQAPKKEAAPAAEEKKAAPAPQKPMSRVPEKKIVDTRKGGAVNLEKYDERLENIAAGKTRQMDAGKEKFKNRGDRKSVV